MTFFAQGGISIKRFLVDLNTIINERLSYKFHPYSILTGQVTVEWLMAHILGVKEMYHPLIYYFYWPLGNEPFFHGRLEIHVKSAHNLPDTDGAFNLTDPYVVCQVGSARLLKTNYVGDCLNPNWNEKFDVFVCHYVNEFNFKVL